LPLHPSVRTEYYANAKGSIFEETISTPFLTFVLSSPSPLPAALSIERDEEKVREPSKETRKETKEKEKERGKEGDENDESKRSKRKVIRKQKMTVAIRRDAIKMSRHLVTMLGIKQGMLKKMAQVMNE
jgi:hypothetical protein